MSIRRGTPRTTHQDHTTYAPVTAVSPGSRGHFASLVFPQSFCCCTRQGPAGRRGLGISPSKPPPAKPEQHAANPFWHSPRCICKQQITPAETLLAEGLCQPCAACWAAVAAHGLGPRHHSPQRNHTPAVSRTALVKVTLSFTAEGSSLEEFELNKLDLMTEWQSFSLYVCGYVYAFLLRKKKNSLKIGLENWKKIMVFTCVSLEHFMTGFIEEILRKLNFFNHFRNGGGRDG